MVSELLFLLSTLGAFGLGFALGRYRRSVATDEPRPPSNIEPITPDEPTDAPRVVSPSRRDSLSLGDLS